MAAPYVTAAEILAATGGTDAAWAAIVAAAIEGAITDRLDGHTPSAAFDAALQRSAVIDGAAAYVEIKAPSGIVSLGADGEAFRLGADSLRSTEPVMRRHLPAAGVGIGGRRSATPARRSWRR